MRVRGSLFVFQLFDVSEAIQMDELSRLLGTHGFRRELGARHLAQTQVWFEPPPAVRPLGEVEFVPGERFQAEMHYYSYGVVSLPNAPTTPRNSSAICSPSVCTTWLP